MFSTTLAAVIAILFYGAIVYGAYAGRVCDNVDDKDGCGKYQVYNCKDPISPDCKTDNYCGIDYLRDFRAATQLQLYVMGTSNQVFNYCPSGTSNVDNLGVVTEAIYSFAGDTPCFRTYQYSANADVGSSTLQMGGVTYTNFTVFGNNKNCDDPSSVFFKCNRNSNVYQVGRIGSYWSWSWKLNNNVNQLCYMRSKAYTPFQHSTELVEDVFVDTLVTRAKAVEFCQNWGGTLLKATRAAYNPIRGAITQWGKNFHVGFTSYKWDFDGSSYNADTDVYITTSGTYMVGQPMYNVLTALGSLNDRCAIACTRRVSGVTVTQPPKCYYGLACRVKGVASLPVQTYHTISDSDLKVRYKDSTYTWLTIFEFSLGGTDASYDWTSWSVGQTFAVSANRQGQGFSPTVSFSLTCSALETFLFPSSITVYRTKANVISIRKSSVGTVTTVSKAWGSLSGTLTFGSFINNAMDVTIVPTNTGSTATLTVATTSTCDCGYDCACYKSPQDFPTLNVADPITLTASAHSTLLFPSGTTTITIATPATTTADTVVTVSATCSLAMSSTTFSWDADLSARSRTISITAPSIISAVQSCLLQFTVNAPQFNAPADLAITVGPMITVSYTSLQASMTQGISYDFQIVLSRVYAGRTVGIAPACSTATFSPASLVFTPSTLTQTVAITGNGAGCTLTLSFGDVGYADVAPPADRTLAFTDMKTVSISAPSLLYVNQVTSNTISIGSSFTASQYIDVAIAWNGPAGVVSFSTSSVHLDITSPNATVTITTQGNNGTGQITFTSTTTYTNNFDTNTAPLFLEVRRPLVPSAVPTVMPVNMSTDPHYSISVTVDIGRLPESSSTSVTVVLNYPVANFDVTPLILQWFGSDSSYSVKTFSIVAKEPVLSGAGFSYTLTTTSPEFEPGTYSLGSMKTYTRFTVAPTVERIVVFGFPVAFFVPVALSNAPQNGTLVLSTSFSSLDVAAPTALSFAFNETTKSLSLSTIRTVPGGTTFTLSFEISTDSSAGIPSLYDKRINTTVVTIQPYRTFTVTCNSTELYFGPNNAILCNFTIAAPPASGVVLQLSTRSNVAVSSNPTAATFTDSFLTFVFAPSYTTHTFAEGASQTVNMAVADTSKEYAPADLTFSFLKRILRTFTFTLQDPSLPVYRSVGPANQNPFVACVTASALPDSGFTAVVNTSVVGIVSNVSSLVFNSSTPSTMCFEMKVPDASTLVFSLPVLATPKYAPSTNSLTVSVRNLESVSVAMNSSLFFVRQGLLITVTSTSTAPSAGTIFATASLKCGGSIDYTSIEAVTTNVLDMTSATSSTITGIARGPCSPALVSLILTGTTTAFNLSTTPAVSFNIRALKTVTAAVSKSILYGGGADRLDLWVSLSGLPETPGYSLTVTIADTSSPSTMSLAVGSFMFSSGSTNRTTFATAFVVSAPVQTSIQLTFSDSAVVEYDLPKSLVFPIAIRPVVNVSFGIDVSPAIVYVSPNLKGTMTVSLPLAPSQGSVVVTPLFVAGSPTAVRFTPPKLTLTASQRNASFFVEALAATSSNEALSVSFTGDAIGYFPQPAAKAIPVRFQALGVVRFLNTVPKSVFATQNFALDIEISYAPPASYAPVNVLISSNSGALVPSTNKITWTPGASVLQTTFTVLATSQAKGVILSFTLDAPNIYEPSINIPSATVDVASTRDILVSFASFVYIGQTISGTLEIGELPPPGTRLALVITPSNAQAVSVSSLFDFTSSSAKTQQFTVEALQAVGNITLTVSIVDGSANFDAPQPMPLDVRALDPITATGLSPGMYVGTSAVVTFQLQRSPQCASGSISIVPAFGSGDASFAPAAGVSFASGASALSKSVVLTASQTSVGAVPISLPVTGACKSIFAAVTAATSTIRIFPRESVTVSTLANMTDPSDGAMFTYVESTIPIIVDLGSPALKHTGVLVQLSFFGSSGAIAFSNATVEFPPNVNRTTVYVTGLVDTTPADLTATVLVGSDVFIPIGAVKLKVLLRIPLTLSFAPSTQLVVVGNTLALTVTIGSAALVGTLQVRLDYAIAGAVNSTTAEFKAGSVELAGTVSIYGIQPAGPAILSVTLFGSAGAFYYATQANFIMEVRPRRYVTVDDVPTEMFITAANKRTLRLRLQSMPTLSNDVVTVSHITSTSVVASPSTVTLTTASPTVTVTLEGTAVGIFQMTKIFVVRSDSTEYAPTPNVTSVAIPVQALLSLSLVGYLTSMYVSDSQTFVVTLPRKPMSPMTVTLSLPGSAYPLGMSSPSLTFDPTGSTTQSMTITATSDTMAASTLRVSTSGSTEFSSVGFQTTLQVNPDNEVAVSGWKSGVYIGSTNAITFSIAIARRPANNSNLTLTIATSTFFDLSEHVFVFGNGTSLVFPATLRGIAPSEGTELVLPITMADPTGFYVQPVPLRVTILPLESYGGSISGTLVYEQETITVELTLPKIPSGPMGVSLTVEKNRTSNSLVAVDEALYSVTPGRDQSISDGATKAIFTVKPLTSPLTVRIGFTTSGASTSEFFILSLPSFIVRFAPLYSVYFLGPANLYRGLETVVFVTIETRPPTGAIAVTPDASSTGTDAVTGFAGIQLSPSSVQFELSKPTTLNFTATGNTNGIFELPISLAIMNVIGFKKATQPSTWSVTVQEPYPLDLVDPPAFVYAFEQNKISLTVDFGTLGASETLTVTLLSNASDYLDIFPTSLEVSTSSPVFQVYAYESVWVNFSLSFTSSARRVVLGPRMTGPGLVVFFRPLKKISVIGPSVTSATIGEEIGVSITVSDKPSPGYTLLAQLVYGGSPSNIVLPPPTQWDESASVLTRTLTFSGRSPTNLQTISVSLYNDPQYEAVAFSFNFQFEALLQVAIEMPLIVFVNNSAPVKFTLPESVSLSIKMIASPLGVFSFSPSSTLNIVLGTSVTGTIMPSQERDVTISFELSADDAARVALPAPRTVKVAVGSQVVVNTPSPDIVVYIKDSIYVRTTVKIGIAPKSSNLKVTPQLICPAGNIVTFTPPFVWFNSTESPAVMSKNIDLRGVTASSPCSLLYAVDGAGYTSSPQRFTVETRNLHKITLENPPTRVFLGTANRVLLNVTLDPTVKMPLADSISVTFASDSPCLTVSPSALFWAPGNQEDHSKIAYVTATCIGTGLVIRTSATNSDIFTNLLPGTITLNALPLQAVSVVDATSGSTDYYMFVGGAALDLDVTIPEALAADESLTVQPSYSGIQGSINVAPAVWAPSPLKPLTKKLLIQAVSVSPQAAIKFVVTGPPRFQAEASGDGRLEVFGPKRVTATVPGTLVVGQQVLVRVTIEDLPYPGELITVVPVWEGANRSLSWTPPSLSWTSSSVGREQFFQFTADEQSGNFNLKLDVSGSYRFVSSAYSGELTITVPQTIVTTQLPTELIKGVRYSIGVNVGKLPAAAATQLFIRLQAEQNELGLECIQLDTTEVLFTGANQQAPVETLIGVTVIRACTMRTITVTVLGAVDEYSRVVAPRYFVTLEPTPFAIDWPAAMYAGSAPQIAVITLRETIFDQLNFANVTISTNGSARIERSLHWGYGSRSEIAIEVSNNVSERAIFNFTVTSNFVTGAEIPDHSTDFLPLVEVRRTTAVQSQLFEGDANKIQVFFDVSTLPTQLGNEPGLAFELVPEPTSPEVTIQPTRLQWSSDSPREQFIYIVGVSPSDAPVTITFRVEGAGKDLVGSWPQPVNVSVSPLLLIDFTVPPKEIYVGSDNLQRINVTVPDNSSVSILLGVGGETSAFSLSPSTLTFVSGRPRWQEFTITGVYPTSRVSYMQYTITSGPTRIAMRVMAASESMAVLALKTVTRTPNDYQFKVVEQEVVTIVVSPAVVGLRCSAGSTTTFLFRYTSNSIVEITPQTSASATTITCTIPDPTYAALDEFTITSTPKKRVSYPAITATYIVVPGEAEAQRQFAVTLSELPSKNKLVVEPVFDAQYLRFPLVQLQFGQFTAKTQYFFIKGLQLTNATNITLKFTGSTSEYDLESLKPASCEVIDNLDVKADLLGAIARPNGRYDGYVTQKNALRVQFQIPRQTIFGSISIVPANSEMRYCISINPCIPINLGNPLLVGGQVRVTAYVYSNFVVNNVTIAFSLSGGVDFNGPNTIEIGNVFFLPLERVLIDTARSKPILYFGGQNAQIIPISITAPPLAGQSVELIIKSSNTLSLSSPLFSWVSSSTGVMTDPYTRDLTVTAVGVGKAQNVTIEWRDRSAITSAGNFEDAFANSQITFDASPLIVFGVAVEGVALAQGSHAVPFTVYLGEVNALRVTVTLPTMPVLSSTVVEVTVDISNPDVFEASETVLRFANIDPYRSPSRTVAIFAKSVYAKGVNNTVTIRITGPPEYQQAVAYGFSMLAQPLLELSSSLTATTIAVGTENAVRFSIWPPVPVDLTLGSIVTCGEVSFAATEQLRWEGSMAKKAVIVTGTLPTSPTSSCFIRTPILSGAWASRFTSPPLDVQMWTRARPSILTDVAASTTGTDIRDVGLTFTVTLSEGGFWKFNQTSTSLSQWIRDGNFRISSTRDADSEPKSIMANLNAQLQGLTQVPLITMTFTGSNTMKISIGPQSTFYASAREIVTISFTSQATQTGVSMEPNKNSLSFEVRGKKESLIDSNVLGSGAASAAIAGGALSMGAATAAGKLQAIMNAFLCPNPDWRDNQNSIDWNDAPIPLSFGSNDELGTYAAVAFSNFLVMMMCLGLHLTAAGIVYYLRKRKGYSDKTFAAARATVRFPSLLLFPMLFFYQAVVSASVKVILYSPVTTFRAIGGITFVLVGFGVPGIAYAIVGPGSKLVVFVSRDELIAEKLENLKRAIRAAKSLARANAHGAAFLSGEATKKSGDNDDDNNVLNERAPNDGAAEDLRSDTSSILGRSDDDGSDDDALPQEDHTFMVKIFLFLFQFDGEWTHPDRYWVQRFGMFFDEFRGGYRWFILVDMGLTFALGIVDGVEPKTKTECYGRLAVTVLLFLLQFLTILYWRPYINRFLNGFFTFAYFIQFLAMLLVASALFSNDPQSGSVSIAVNLLIFFSALLMIKTVLDVARVLNENFGLDAVFGDNDGFSAVRIRTKTSQELALVEREVENALERQATAANKPSSYDPSGNKQRPLLHPVDLDESDESNDAPFGGRRGYERPHLAAGSIMHREDNDDDLDDLVVDYGADALPRHDTNNSHGDDDDELARFFDDDGEFNEYVELGMKIEEERAHSSVSSDDQPQPDNFVFDPSARVQLHHHRYR